MSNFDSTVERNFLKNMVDGLEWTMESPSGKDVANKAFAEVVNEWCRLSPSEKVSTASGEPRFLINGHGQVAGLKGDRGRTIPLSCEQ